MRNTFQCLHPLNIQIKKDYYVKIVCQRAYPAIISFPIILNICVESLSSVQMLSRVWLFVTTSTAAHQASLSITSSQSLLRLMSIKSVMPFNHLILCHSLLLSIFPSIGSFQVSQLFTTGGQSSGAPAQHQSFQWIFTADFLWIDWFDLVESLAHYCLLLKLTSQVLCFHIGNSSCFCSCFSFKLLYVFKLRFGFLWSRLSFALKYVIMYAIICAEFLRI